MAMVTGPGWGPPRSPALALGTAPASLAALTTAVVFVQLLLGAITRHMGAGLAIPDFPLAFGRLVPPFETPLVAVHYAHRCGAVTVAAFAAILVRTILHHHRPLRRLALLLGALVVTQLTFGALIIWTHRAVVPTTTHLVLGAATLATCVAITLRAARQPVARSSVSVVGRPALA
jgi:cytochrome c oxidase assembly protein subunit 15